MSKNGTWGGDLEINAISNCYKCNIIVYQDRRPNIELLNFPESKHVLRLAYFGSCHYNSVRGKDHSVLSNDSSPGMIVLKPDEKALGKSKEQVRVRQEQSGKKEKQKKKNDNINSTLNEKKTKVEEKVSLNTEKKEQSMKRDEEKSKEKPENALNVGNSILPQKEQAKSDIHQKVSSLIYKTGMKEERREKDGKKSSSKMSGMKREDIIKRNLAIIRKMGEKFDKEQQHEHKHHHCHDKWCGDLPFDQLVTEDVVQRLKVFASEKHLVKTITFLTKKCPCRSGSYFKYCCYPKMKVW